MTFSEIFKGTSVGGTFLPERYELPDTVARYLRITINGNTENDYASIYEIRINAFDESSQLVGHPSLYSQAKESPSTIQNIDHYPTVFDKYLQTDGPFDIILNGTKSDNGDSIRYSVVNLPEHGTLSRGSTANSIRYSPIGGYIGSDAFSYMVTDRRGSSSNVATVNIAVSNESLNPHYNYECSYLQAVQTNMNGFIKYFDDRLNSQRSVSEPIADQYIVLLKHSSPASSTLASEELRSMADDMRNKGGGNTRDLSKGSHWICH